MNGIANSSNIADNKDMKKFVYPENYEERCHELLDTAFEHVPFYSSWKQYDPGRAVRAEERFAALPILTKADMRACFPDGLIMDDKDLGAGLKNEEVEYTFTSGTTSEKVINIWNQSWWNASEESSWKLNAALSGLKYPAGRQAKLASALNVGISCEEDLPMSHRLMGNTLYLNEKTNVIQWQERHMRRMAQELNDFGPLILEANPSLLARLCWWAADNDVYIKSPKAIVFTFEFPSRIHLKEIRQVFRDAAFISSYGSTETGFVLEQCEDGLMHQNTDFCRIDFVPFGEQYGEDRLGRIAVSTFGNPWSCIIRFDVGDVVRIHEGTCSCGRGIGFTAESIEGRVGNITFDTEGHAVTTKMLDDSLADIDGLRDYHLEQHTADKYVLEVMSTTKNNKIFEESIYNSLRSVYGNCGEYEIRICDDILPGPAGKFRRTQANFDFDERGLFK